MSGDAQRQRFTRWSPVPTPEASQMTVGSSIPLLHDFRRWPRVVLGSTSCTNGRSPNQTGASLSRESCRILPAVERAIL